MGTFRSGGHLDETASLVRPFLGDVGNIFWIVLPVPACGSHCAYLLSASVLFYTLADA